VANTIGADQQQWKEDVWKAESDRASENMGNTESWGNGQQQAEQQGWDTSGGSGSESGGMGNATRELLNGVGTSPREAGFPEFANPSIRQTQPSLGGDTDGSADWMDNAELYVTSDNRTDELRLLGNGVVPATAERAFRVLMDQLINQ
jgi:hypothetical protein